jgi:hypothetical protein
MVPPCGRVRILTVEDAAAAVTVDNLLAISPLFMLDAVRLGPSGPGAGTRIGVGGGVRVTLVDSVDFSVGYLANLRRAPQEPSGAFFLTMQFKDLF